MTLGVENMQILHISDSDIAPLRESDWDEGEIPHEHLHLISPVTAIHRLYEIEYCKLACIGKYCNLLDILGKLIVRRSSVPSYVSGPKSIPDKKQRNGAGGKILSMAPDTSRNPSG